MKRQKLSFDQLLHEVEPLSMNDGTAIKGGFDNRPKLLMDEPIIMPNGGGGGSNTFGMTHTSFKYPSTNTTLSSFLSWASSLPEGTYTNQGNGSFNYTPISDPVFSVINNQSYISFDNGNTWNPAFDTINVYGSSSAPLYPLENQPVYNINTDTYSVALTTLSDYNGDKIFGGIFSVIGSITGNKSLATWINNFSLTDQSNIRANVNDMFIDILKNETGARVIPHASGPTTVEIPNFSSGLSGLTVFMQNISDKLYIDLLNNHVMTAATDGSNALILNETKYYEYKYGGAFQNFLNGL